MRSTRIWQRKHNSSFLRRNCHLYWAELASKHLNNFEYNIGVTEKFLDTEIPGSIDSILVNDRHIAIQWSGFILSEADELYHCIWENTSGLVSASVDDVFRNPITMMTANQSLNTRRPVRLSNRDWIFRVRSNVHIYSSDILVVKSPNAVEENSLKWLCVQLFPQYMSLKMSRVSQRPRL